jgi:hypothetical protein
MSTYDRKRYEAIMADPVKKTELYARNEVYRLANPEKRRESQQRWHRNNLERSRELSRDSAKKRRHTLRAEAITAYGSVCVGCGEVRPGCLEFDHIHEDGCLHRRSLSSPTQLYAWLKNNNYPKDVVQLLCGSCHNLKSYSGAEIDQFDVSSCIGGEC